jgi:ribokinase
MATRPARICVVGSANVDLTFRAPRLPRPGETVAGSAFQLGHGGKGANQAVMAARLGAHVSFIAKVGDDPFGEAMLRRLRDEGIDTRHVGVEPGQATGAAAIVVDDTAQNCIIVVPGANHHLRAADLAAAADAITEADVLIAQLEVPIETVAEALRRARTAGVRTVLNPAPALPVPDALLQLADLCVPNETELEALVGSHADASVEGAARRLLARGPGGVLVTLGQRGALLLHDGAVERFEARRVAAIDPTGAGDAFIGSLAVFWAEGTSLAEAIARAGAAAALSVTRPGALDSFPRRAEVESFLGATP